MNYKELQPGICMSVLGLDQAIKFMLDNGDIGPYTLIVSTHETEHTNVVSVSGYTLDIAELVNFPRNSWLLTGSNAIVYSNP